MVNPQTGRQLLVATFIAAMAMVTWSEVKDYKRTPQPARYVGAGVVYGLLGILAPFISFELAGLFGIGLLLTLLYQHYKSPPADNSGESIATGPQRPPRGEATNN